MISMKTFQTNFFLFASFLMLVFICSCSSGVSEQEFQNKFKEMSNNRIEFRKNMKALGDSTISQRDFSRSIMLEIGNDIPLDSFFKPEYVAYNDSIRRELGVGDNFFNVQYLKNKPLITQWEKREMDLDQLVEKIKSGELSEREGLDSIIAIKESLTRLIVVSDSLVKLSTTEYWKFRNTYNAYKYNLRNLKFLYAKEIFYKKKYGK
jgi:hypothetical protein